MVSEILCDILSERDRVDWIDNLYAGMGIAMSYTCQVFQTKIEVALVICYCLSS